MRNISTRVHLEDGTLTRRKKDLRRLLNLNYLNYTNKTHAVGDYDLPQLYCSTKIIPDYLALYNQPGDYQRTAYTCVCFYTYDNSFDGIHGLFNAIYYNDKKLLHFYKERFKNVRFFISPDYSQFGDLQNIENIIRLWKARTPAEKFTNYSLDYSNPNAKGKAEAYEKGLGYTKDNAAGLIKQIHDFVIGGYKPYDVSQSKYGTKYKYRIPVTGPNGKTKNVIAVYQIDSGCSIPRLITNYVEGK